MDLRASPNKNLNKSNSKFSTRHEVVRHISVNLPVDQFGKRIILLFTKILICMNIYYEACGKSRSIMAL